MVELWKDALGYEGLYEVSNLGRARRVVTQTGRPSGRIMKPGDRRGYSKYTFTRENQKRMFCAHRLVWEAFNGPIPDGLQINHLNGDKRDNRLTNLEVCTASENMKHAYRTLGIPRPYAPSFGERNGRAKLKESDLPEIKALYARGLSQQKIADIYGVNQTNISLILRGRSWRKSQLSD